MLNKITIYIALSIAVSLSVGYGVGNFVASSKAERDIAAIRAMMEEEKTEKKNKEELARAAMEKYQRDMEEYNRQMLNTPTKSY